MSHRVTITVSNRRSFETLRFWVEAPTRSAAVAEAFELASVELGAIKHSFGQCVTRVSCMSYK